MMRPRMRTRKALGLQGRRTLRRCDGNISVELFFFFFRWRSLTGRLSWKGDLRQRLELVREHLALLREGGQTELVVLRGLEPGLSTFVRDAAGGETSVLAERRVLRQTSVVFEVRSGSKMRSWRVKLGRGTHKRQMWLVNEELIVTKEIGAPVVHHELCREYVWRMQVADVSQGAHSLLGITFASGFVFTAHFETRRELEVWQSLLRPDDLALFPWGLPFEEASQAEARAESGSKQHLLQPLDAEAERTVLERLAHIEGLMAAQSAALNMSEGVSARATRKRQARMQRQLFSALREMNAISFEASRRLFGLPASPVKPAAAAAVATTPAARRAAAVTRQGSDSWSESDDASGEGAVEEDVNLAPIDKPQPSIAATLAALPPPPDAPRSAQVVPPMPSVPPAARMMTQSSEMESEVLYAVRRQLALRELELTRVKSQLANLVNETWKKNLQVAQLKRDLNNKQNAEEVRRQTQPPATANDNNTVQVEAVASVVHPLPHPLPPQPLPLPQATSEPSVTAAAPPPAAAATVAARSFLGLNMDVLRKIASLLSVSQVSALCQTSRAARDLLWNDEVVWRALLMARIPAPRGIVPASVAAAAPHSSREQLRLLYAQFLCHGCGALLPFGPPDNFAWEKLEMPLCRKPECFHAATVTAVDAVAQYALTTEELSRFKFELSGTVPVYRRRDIVQASHRKFGGSDGLGARLRSLAKQKQLVLLSRLGHITTRPTSLLLE